MDFSFFRSRSKSRTRQTLADVALPQQSTYLGSSNGIPHFQTRSRSKSTSQASYYQNDDGPHYRVEYRPPSSSRMSYTSTPSTKGYHMGYAPSAPYYGPNGQVIYPSGRKGYHLDDSPMSSHLETQPRGRPRSSTASEKLQISMAPAEPYRLALDGYTTAPADHEGRGGIFGSFMSSIRSRSKSKSRERDALFSARSRGSAPYTQVDSRGRPIYEKDIHSSRDVGADLARQMEKDLRLQDLDDPYRPVRRDRSNSVSSRTSERRHRDLDPDVRDNTKYNAANLKYPMTRIHSEPHHSSGYHTDAQPSMLRRSTTSTPMHPRSSRANPASHGVPTALVGWYNQRGDQFISPGTIICQPKELQYSRRFDQYPEVGKGYGDSKGNVIDAYGRLIKRVG